MNARFFGAAVVAAVSLAYASNVSAQTEFAITFRATSFETNSAGRIVSRQINNRTLLQAAAQAGGVADLRTLALVYHVKGTDFGDTIDIVNAANGAVLATPFGLYFGQDPSLGRTALTNGSNTEIREIDYVYTSQNSHSMGAAFVDKRYSGPTNRVHTLITAQIEWLILPEGTNGTKICNGSFTTGKPLF